MRSLDAVIKEVADIQRNLDSLCGYDPGSPPGLIRPPAYASDSPVRCTADAVWHLMAGTPPNHMMLQACDHHLAMCVSLVHREGHEPQMHEFGSACGLPRTFFIVEAANNTCMTMDTMREVGLVYDIESRITSAFDENRCTCGCPACATWLHLRGECSNAVDELGGYTHMQYMKLMMGAEIN